MILNIILALLISFSYKIIEQIIVVFSEKQIKNTIYFWGLWLLSASYFYKGNFIYRLPQNVMMSLPLIISIIVVSFIITKRYNDIPKDKHNPINYMILFPILEEAAFRGIILPLLMKGTVLGKWVTPLNIIMLSPAIIVSALLFAAACLQYQKWSKETPKHLLIMFAAGLLYGIVVQVTRSIIFSVIMHIAYHVFSYYHRKANLKKHIINN